MTYITNLLDTGDSSYSHDGEEKLNEKYSVNIDLERKSDNFLISINEKSAEHCGITIGEIYGSPIYSKNQPNITPEECKYITYYCSTPHSVSINNRKAINFRAREIVIVPSSSAWQLYLNKNYKLTTIALRHNEIHRLLKHDEAIPTGRLPTPFKLDQLMRNFITSAFSIPSDDEFECLAEGITESFVSLISLCLNSTRKSQTIDSTAMAGVRLTQFKNYIDSNITSPNLTISSIADSFGLSQRYIHTVFNEQGICPGEYIRNKRLEKSVMLLKSAKWRNSSITDIAGLCGYNNLGHFSTQFKNKYGLPPSEFKILNK